MLKTVQMFRLFILFLSFAVVMTDARISSAAVNYSVTPMSSTVQVVKGQSAEIVLKIALAQGFSTTGGINFSVTGLPQGTSYSFIPVPLKNSGGVVLKIATGTLPANTYNLTIQANEAASDSVQISTTLKVTTTNQSSIAFSYNNGSTSQSVTTLDVTGQKELIITPSALDSSGTSITDIVLSSDDPSKLGVYKMGLGYWIYARATGTAHLIATMPDNVTASLPITISVPSESHIDIGIDRESVTNAFTDFLNLSMTFFFAQGQSYSAGWTGAISITSSTLDFNRNPPPYWYGGTFKINQTTTDLGTYLFHGEITDGVQGPIIYQAVVPLTITNDPTYAGLYMPVRSLDSSIFPMMYEMFTVEFYNSEGVLQFPKNHQSYEMNPQPMAFIGAIPPGSYKIKFVPMSTSIQSQWYPNAASATDAELVTFTAGQNAGPLYFFASPVPTATLSVSRSGTGDGSVFSTPSGIDCPAFSCSGQFTTGSSVTLTAVPNASSTFGSWTSCTPSTGNSCSVTMDTAKSATASFNAAKAQIGSTGYATLAAAYAIDFGTTPILLLDGDLGESLTVTKSVTLKGGYNASFSGLTGLFSNLTAPLTISTGSLTASMLVLK